MKLPVVSRDAQTLHIHYMNGICGVPISSTALTRRSTGRFIILGARKAYGVW